MKINKFYYTPLPDYLEIKKSKIGQNSKVNHLSYVEARIVLIETKRDNVKEQLEVYTEEKNSTTANLLHSRES